MAHLLLMPRRPYGGFCQPYRNGAGLYPVLYSISPAMYTGGTAPQREEHREGKATTRRQGEGRRQRVCSRADERGVVSSGNPWWRKRAALCREIEVKEVAMTQVSPHPCPTFVLQFVGELFKCTRDAPTEEAHREALHAFCNAFLPWVDPSEVPHPPPTLCPLVKEYHIDQHGIVWIILTQEGLPLFRAWLRSRGGDSTLWSS
jgi:hypothetical protein